MSDNIKVAIKVRPLIDREKDEPLQWRVSGNTITPMDSKRKGEAGFQFDHIFDMRKTNAEIFNTVVKPIVNSAVNGFNGTVFAYGQTGSGKTYTMMGTELEPGIIPLAIDYMFDAIENTTGREFLIRFSYFEIYNEKVNDLLEVKNADLKIKEENGRIFVHNCSEKVTKGPQHMLATMKRGEKNRSIGETNMNERSSRSHTIFRITIESRAISSDSDGAIQIAQLNLVDLAGSERASQTGATGDRFKEGKHINLSLSTLGLVIKQLSESEDKDKPNFVNFRDSKLTRILQASLGGNSLTAILCTVTPATFEETNCTLSFASRAKSIKNKPELNEDLSDEALLKRYRKQIVELSKELEKANQTIKDRQNNVLVDRVELLKEYIVTGNTKKNVRRRSCPVKFDHAINRSFELPTIRESLSPETPKIDRIKRRQSIIQNVNMANETFETALADFEIELLQSDLPPDEDFFISKRRAIKPRVKFSDDVLVYNDTPDCTPNKTRSPPRRRCNCTNASSSPGTPKSILRERLQTVIEEHISLETFTVLEKQLNREEVQTMNLDDNEKTLRNLKKSLDDTGILYSDVNKKYADLQTEHSQLLEECGVLRKQVESLSAVQDRLGRMEVENKDLNNKLNAALKKQKYLEDESVSQAYQMESMQTKFKAREKELESSLQIAWKTNDPAQAEKASNEIVQLQNLVKALTEEIELLKTQKSTIQESETLVSEIESLKEKLEETSKLLKQSDFEKTSLADRLDSLSQRSLMKSKIEEYDKLLKNLEEEKILSLQRFDELAKELEVEESGLEISALQKAVENLSSHLTELEKGDVNVRKKFSISLACIEFLCQQNSDNKLLDDGLDLSLNFEDWKKSVSYNEKEKSNIILELRKFRESVIRRSKSATIKLENNYEKAEVKKENKETSTDEDNTGQILESVKEISDAKILELTLKLEEAIVEKQHLENQLEEVKSKLLEAGEKWKDYDNLMLKFEISETEFSELNERFKKLETQNMEVKTKLFETTDKLNNYENGVEFLKFESQFESKLAEKEVECNKINSKVIDLEAENLEMKSNLSEALKKLETYESNSQNMKCEQELSNKLKEIEEKNSLIKSQLSKAEEELKNVADSPKLIVNLQSELKEKVEEISELSKRLKEFEEDNEKLKSKLDEAEGKLNNYEASKSDNRLIDDFESKLSEKETELIQLKLKSEELTLENMEIKLKLTEADEKLKNYENLVQNSKTDSESIENLKIQLSEKEEKLNDITQKSEELEHLNLEIKSQLSEATEKIQNYINVVEFLKSELKEKENELIASYSKIKELEDENTEINLKLETVDNLKSNETSFISIDSRVEEKEAEVSHLSLRIKELGDENFELKSRVEDAEEKLKNYEVTIDALNSDIKRLSAKLQEKEADLLHLNVRYKELQNINNSFTKAAVQSMNNTSEEPFADLKSGVDFVESYLAENDAIKKRLEDFEKNVSIFRENVDEQMTFAEGLEKDNLVRNDPNTSSDHKKNMSTPTKMNRPENPDTPKSAYKSFNDENDFTSIFTNDSYFDKMEVSETVESVIENETQNESQEFTAPSMMINILKSNDVPTLKRRIKELETQNEHLDILYRELIDKVNDKGSEELANSVKKFKNVKVALEIENARLREDLQQKIQESEEVKNGIQGLKMDIEKLQQTIYLLNSENLDLICKLNAEKEKIKEGENSSQGVIDELKSHVSQISEEKLNLEKEVSLLNEKLSSLHTTSSIPSNDEMKTRVVEYNQKIDVLETENRKLTADLMDKIKELDSIKECKALQYDHECSYKDKNEALTREINSLQNEITELSDDLMKHIDESETTKHELDTALKKLQIYEQSSKSAESPENISILLREKKHLEAEVVELKSKVTKLSNENTEFTSNLSIIFDELEKSPEVNPCRNSLPLSLESQSRRISNSWRNDQNVQALNNKIITLEEQIEHLTILNTKLSDLKLSSCTQCAHLKELNENKRALKLEVKCLNNKLENLQIKFREKCANTEVLRLKASEELNTSIGNVTLNSSTCEGMNITQMEENIRVLSNEKETLKEEYDKLANLYQEKCCDLETLKDNQPLNISSPISPSTPRTSKTKGTRLSKVESSIKLIGEDLQQHKEKLSNLNSELQKFKELKDKLKSAEDSSVTAEEKVNLLESEIASLYKNIGELNESNKILISEKLNLEVELEILMGDKLDNKKRVGDLQNIVDDLNREKMSLSSELEVAKEEKEQLVARQKYEDSNRENMEAALKEYRESIEVSEKRIREISANLSKAVKENQDLTNEITRLQSLVQKNICETGDKKEESQELESAKKLIIKEMKSLTSEVQDPSNKSVSDLFQVFLKTILSKEHEIMKALKDRFDQEKLKLVEAKQQSEDAEKRANTWAKTLENDIEKLQSDLTHLEQQNVELKKQIGKMESELEETEHENKSLREKMEVLRADYNTLQLDFEKNSKYDAIQEGSVNVIQEREKMQASIKEKEVELQSKMKQEKEEYNKKIGELKNSLKSLESKNMDLKNNVDGLEANEAQLRSIIDIKNKEITKNNQKIKDLHVELEKLDEVNNKLSEENLEKNRRIEEITLLLKNKCDTLSEYKTKMEILMPEYDHLRIQIEERKLSIDRYKEEIETLRAASTQELNIFKDKFVEEEIKSAGLKKQLDELNNKNSVLLQELEAMGAKCLEMEAANEKLMKKMRNSTSKSRVEKDMEEIMDRNRTLENNLEGASNRIADLLEAKTKAMKELVDLKGKVDTVKRENEELKIAVDSFKSRHNDLIELRGKYEELLQEKNRIKLELEEKKLTVPQKDKEIKELLQELDEMKTKNKELDVEAEELADKIRENETEIGRLEDANHYLKENFTKEIEELKSQLKNSMQMNTDLRAQMEIMKKTEVGVMWKEPLQEKNQVKPELEEKKLTVAQKDKEIKEILQELDEMKTKNEELDVEAEELADKIRENETEIGRLEDANHYLKENFTKEIEELKSQLRSSMQMNTDLRAQIEIMKKTDVGVMWKENERLKGRIVEIENRLETKSCESSRSTSPMAEVSKRKKRRSDLFNQKRNLDEVSDSGLSSSSAECQCFELRKTVADLGREIAMKNGIIATLNIQIQSENFPYQKKCQDLQDELILHKNKTRQLQTEVYNLKKSMMDTSTQECEVCKRWRLNQRHQEVQCTLTEKIYLSGTSSGIVGEFKQIEKLEKEKALMRQLCRSRLTQIKQLEARIEELTEKLN